MNILNHHNIAISVIVLIDNAHSYVARCLESIKAQTLENIEIILVKTSSDVSLSIYEKYAKHNELIKIINQNHSSFGAALNMGIARATGEYIAFIDTFDWLEPEMYEVLYEIASDQNVDVVHCLKYSTKDGSNTKVANVFANSIRHHVNIRSDYKFYVPMLLFYSKDMYSSIFRKGFLIENQISFSEIPGSNAQNLGFTFLVFCYLGSFYIHEAPLYHLNQNQEDVWGDTVKAYKYAMSSVGEYLYIKNLIDQRCLEGSYIRKRYMHLGMAKIFLHIRHGLMTQCNTIRQKREFLRSVELY